MTDSNGIDLEDHTLPRETEDVARAVQRYILLGTATLLMFIMLISTIFWCIQKLRAA